MSRKYHSIHLKGNYVNSLVIVPVTSVDVEQIILSLRNKSDNINTCSTFIIKEKGAVFFIFCVISWSCTRLFKIIESDSHTN